MLANLCPKSSGYDIIVLGVLLDPVQTPQPLLIASFEYYVSCKYTTSEVSERFNFWKQNTFPSEVT